MNEFNRLMQAQFNKMCQTGKLFRSSMTGQEVWNLYLYSFEQDPIFRDPESSEHNCNLCHNFIRRYGNIIALDSNNVIMTLFDFESKGEYEPVSQALAFALHNSVIKDVFFETFYSLNSLNYEKCKNTNTMFKLGIPSNVKRYTKEEAENLIPELAEHRKVLEVLGATTMIEPSDKQLSGLGFNATVRDELIVKVSGSHKRVLKIKF